MQISRAIITGGVASPNTQQITSATAAGSLTAGGSLSQTTIGKTSGGYAGLRLAVDASFYSWIIGAQYNASNSFEITPSTAVGGSTFTTPVFKITNTGAATFSSSVTATGSFKVLGQTYTSIELIDGGTGDPGYAYWYSYGTKVASIGLGDTYFNTGNVGIGTSSPLVKLQVKTATDINIGIQTSAIDATGVQINAFNDAGAANIPLQINGSTLYFSSGSSGTERMRITSGGGVLIGTTTDATGKLQVNGTIYATGFYESSDIRFKNILETNPNINLSAIDVIKFTRKDNDTNQVRYGYSAQQVQSILPDAVTGTDFLNVNYLDVHTLKIAQLEQEIKDLKAKMN
jgi:hypothetical protein